MEQGEQTMSEFYYGKEIEKRLAAAEYMAEPCDGVRLTRVVESVCARCGYVGSAEFVRMDAYNIRWTRGTDASGVSRVSFQVCDYFATAPDAVLRSVLNYTMRRIAGKKTAGHKVYSDWIMSAQCKVQTREAYVARNGGAGGPEGRHRDLSESVRRLAAMGLVDPEADDVWVTWSDRLTAESGTLTTYSPAAHAVLVNGDLDVPAEEMSDRALDYAVYSGWARVCVGTKASKAEFDREVAARLAEYPGDVADVLDEISEVWRRHGCSAGADLGGGAGQ